MRRVRSFPRARKNLAYVCLGGLSFAAAASCGARSEVDRSPFSGTGASRGVVASSGTGAGGTLDVVSSSAAGDFYVGLDGKLSDKPGSCL